MADLANKIYLGLLIFPYICNNNKNEVKFMKRYIKWGIGFLFLLYSFLLLSVF